MLCQQQNSFSLRKVVGCVNGAPPGCLRGCEPVGCVGSQSVQCRSCYKPVPLFLPMPCTLPNPTALTSTAAYNHHVKNVCSTSSTRLLPHLHILLPKPLHRRRRSAWCTFFRTPSPRWSCLCSACLRSASSRLSTGEVWSAGWSVCWVEEKVRRPKRIYCSTDHSSAYLGGASSQ